MAIIVWLLQRTKISPTLLCPLDSNDYQEVVSKESTLDCTNLSKFGWIIYETNETEDKIYKITKLPKISLS